MPMVLPLAADVSYAVGPTWTHREGDGVVALDAPTVGTSGLVADIADVPAGADATARAVVASIVTAVHGTSLPVGSRLTVGGWLAQRFTVGVPSGGRVDVVRDGILAGLGLAAPLGNAPLGYTAMASVTVTVTVVDRPTVRRATVLVAVGPDAVGDSVRELTSGVGLGPAGTSLTEVCTDGAPTLAGVPVDVLWLTDTTRDMEPDEDTVGETARQTFDALVTAGGNVRGSAIIGVSSPTDLDLNTPGFAWIDGSTPDAGLSLAYAVTFARFQNNPADTLVPYPGVGDFEQVVAAGVIATEAMAREAYDPTYGRAFRPGAVRVMGFATSATGDGDDQYYFAMDPYRWGGTYLDRIASVIRWYTAQGIVPFALSDTFLDARCPSRENLALCLTTAVGGPWVRISTATDTDIQTASSQLVANVTRAGGQYTVPSAAISSTVRVWVRGNAVLESPSNGWTYDPDTRTLTLHGTAVAPPGASVRMSYVSWGG